MKNSYNTRRQSRRTNITIPSSLASAKGIMQGPQGFDSELYGRFFPLQLLKNYVTKRYEQVRGTGSLVPQQLMKENSNFITNQQQGEVVV